MWLDNIALLASYFVVNFLICQLTLFYYALTTAVMFGIRETMMEANSSIFWRELFSYETCLTKFKKSLWVVII